jgi:hypothetical protein
MTTKKPKSLYPATETEQINVNFALIVLMSVLFGFVLALIGFATMHYPSIQGVI